MAKLLHKAIGLGNGSAADPAAYAAYQQHFAEAPVAVLRDCLEFKSDRQPIDISEVRGAGVGGPRVTACVLLPNLAACSPASCSVPSNHESWDTE